MILAVDTSLPMLSAALLGDAGVVGAVSLEGKESRNEKLLPAVDWLLRESGVERSALTLLAVTRGPGSFTGVRIALATMEGLAVALSLPIVAMSTHEAAAQAVREADSRLVVYSDAGRGEFYVSAFADGEETMAPALMRRSDLDDLLSDADESIDLGRLVQHTNVAVLAAQRARAIRDAGGLAAYADPTPLYVRLAEAEVKLAEKQGA